MNITKIELHNFRKYKNYKIEKFSNLNLIIGTNGIGKTSILESIYVGSLAKTFKSSDDFTMISYNQDVMKIKIYFYDDFIKNNIEFILNKSGKKTKINGNIQSKLSDFISQYKVILLSPDELKIIKASPNIRRNYLNIQISQLHKEYVSVLNNYNILLKNKNDFLKKIMINGYSDVSYLDILDDKLAELGIKIFNYRNDYINKINEFIEKKYNTFCKNKKLIIKYISDFNLNNQEKIVGLLKKNRNKEISIGMGNIGIHRDDYEFILDGHNLKEFGSQGIQKLVVLSMKLSEIDIFKNYYNIYPILLLDDLFSELDKENRNKIFKALDKELQIFITTTDVKNIEKKIIEKSKVFNLNERK